MRQMIWGPSPFIVKGVLQKKEGSVLQLDGTVDCPSFQMKCTCSLLVISL